MSDQIWWSYSLNTILKLSNRNTNGLHLCLCSVPYARIILCISAFVAYRLYILPSYFLSAKYSVIPWLSEWAAFNDPSTHYITLQVIFIKLIALILRAKRISTKKKRATHTKKQKKNWSTASRTLTSTPETEERCSKGSGRHWRRYPAEFLPVMCIWAYGIV